MKLISLISLLIANKEAILQLVALLKELLDAFTDNAVALSEEQLDAMAADKASSYPQLAAHIEAEGGSFRELLELILQNTGAILEIIRAISEMFR